jgi:hypothetical protein
MGRAATHLTADNHVSLRGVSECPVEPSSQSQGIPRVGRCEERTPPEIDQYVTIGVLPLWVSHPGRGGVQKAASGIEDGIRVHGCGMFYGCDHKPGETARYLGHSRSSTATQRGQNGQRSRGSLSRWLWRYLLTIPQPVGRTAGSPWVEGVVVQHDWVPCGFGVPRRNPAVCVRVLA